MEVFSTHFIMRKQARWVTVARNKKDIFLLVTASQATNKINSLGVERIKP